MLACVDLRLDLGLTGAEPFGSSRTWPVLALLAVLLAAVVATAALRARRNDEGIGGRLAAWTRSATTRTAATVAAGVTTLAGCAYLALSALVLLPLTEAPGYSLTAIYAAVGAFDGGPQLAADIAGPAVVCGVLALVASLLLIALARLRVPWPWPVAAALASLTVLAVVNFFLGFSFGTDVPDVLPPGAGTSPASDAWFVVLSQAALCVAVPLVTALLPASARAEAPRPADAGLLDAG